MPKLVYELDESIGDFEAGRTVEVIAQYGDWHAYDVKLRPKGRSSGGSIELTWDRLREQTSPVETL